MIKTSNRKYDELSVGTTVGLSIPDVDGALFIIRPSYVDLFFDILYYFLGGKSFLNKIGHILIIPNLQSRSLSKFTSS